MVISQQTQGQALPATGERFLPGMPGDIALEHLHRYLLGQSICRGARVLDIACGEGYGSALLAEVAGDVIGVDVCAAAVAHARARYAGERLRFLQGDCARIPLPDGSIDVVVSFETIEHHDRHAEMLAEIRRVLRPAGVLLISSPDRHVYSEQPGYRNPYHVRELSAEEFRALMEGSFKQVRFFGQRVCYGSVVMPEAGSAPLLTFEMAHGQTRGVSGLHAPMYWLALASDGDLPEMPAGLFEQRIEACEPVERLKNALDACTRQLQAETQARAQAQARARELATALEAASLPAEQRRLGPQPRSTDVDARAERLAAELAAVYASTSWRLIAPLRALVNWLRGNRAQRRQP